MSDFGMNQSSDAREDMKGPENIDQLLNQLNKKVDIEPKNDSTISVEDLENLSNASAPSTNRRKRKSDKNTIRLAV